MREEEEGKKEKDLDMEDVHVPGQVAAVGEVPPADRTLGVFLLQGFIGSDRLLPLLHFVHHLLFHILLLPLLLLHLLLFPLLLLLPRLVLLQTVPLQALQPGERLRALPTLERLLLLGVRELVPLEAPLASEDGIALWATVNLCGLGRAGRSLAHAAVDELESHSS